MKERRKEKKEENGEQGEKGEREKSNRNLALLLLKWQPREELKGNGCEIKA